MSGPTEDLKGGRERGGTERNKKKGGEKERISYGGGVARHKVDVCPWVRRGVSEVGLASTRMR